MGLLHFLSLEQPTLLVQRQEDPQNTDDRFLLETISLVEIHSGFDLLVFTYASTWESIMDRIVANALEVPVRDIREAKLDLHSEPWKSKFDEFSLNWKRRREINGEIWVVTPAETPSQLEECIVECRAKASGNNRKLVAIAQRYTFVEWRWKLGENWDPQTHLKQIAEEYNVYFIFWTDRTGRG